MHSLLIYRLLSLGQILLVSLISECLLLLQYCILKTWRSWGDLKGAGKGVARVLLFTHPRVLCLIFLSDKCKDGGHSIMKINKQLCLPKK